MSAEVEKNIKRTERANLVAAEDAASKKAATKETGEGVGFPDVPQESMALVEQMMVNLRRASSHSAPDC